MLFMVLGPEEGNKYPGGSSYTSIGVYTYSTHSENDPQSRSGITRHSKMQLN